VIGALREIYDDPRVKVPSKVFNADRKIEEDLPIYIRQSDGASYRRAAPSPL
jgi:hypothetical protein